MRNTWREINNMLGKGKKADLPDNYDDQRVYSEPSDIANAFNSYFTSIGASLANKIPTTNSHFMDYIHNSPHLYFLYRPTHLKCNGLVIRSVVTPAVALMIFSPQLSSLLFPLSLTP